jgi:hypothetical protein
MCPCRWHAHAHARARVPACPRARARAHTHVHGQSRVEPLDSYFYLNLYQSGDGRIQLKQTRPAIDSMAAGSLICLIPRLRDPMFAWFYSVPDPMVASPSLWGSNPCCPIALVIYSPAVGRYTTKRDDSTGKASPEVIIPGWDYAYWNYDVS